jgi:gliding motility-associated lipoprotein GldD
MRISQLINVKKLLSLKWVLLIFFAGFISCNSTYTSKKKGYFKIDFPKRSYVKFDNPAFPYSFEYPAYAKIEQDSSYFDTNSSNPYWINIDFPGFNGKIFISYKIIGGSSVYKVKTPDGKYRDSTGKNTFQNMVDDSYKLTYKNDIKAYSIEDSVMHTPNNVTGVYFRLSGSVATAQQFFLSDTTHNFLRGALYFDATPNEDSLRPVNNFLQEDMKHIINTLKWK